MFTFLSTAKFWTNEADPVFKAKTWSFLSTTLLTEPYVDVTHSEVEMTKLHMDYGNVNSIVTAQSHH